MALKKYLPFENYTLVTKLSVDEVSKRIRDNTEPKRQFRMTVFRKNSFKPYEGDVFKDSFKISRIINYRNSFLPIIQGRVSSFLGKSQVSLQMKPGLAVLIFISMWMGIVGLVCVGILFLGLLRWNEVLKNGFSPMLLIPFGMFLFGYFLITLSFKSETKIAKQFLQILLEAEQNDQ